MQNLKDGDVCSFASITTSSSLACLQHCEYADEKSHAVPFITSNSFTFILNNLREMFSPVSWLSLEQEQRWRITDGKLQAFLSSGGLLSLWSHRLLLTSNRDPISGNSAIRLWTCKRCNGGGY